MADTDTPRVVTGMRDAHASGKFSATDAQWQHLADTLNTVGGVLGVTEARGRRAPDGWHGGGSRNECDLLWRDPWHRLDGGVLNLHTSTWRRGRRAMDGVELTWKWLDCGDFTLLRVVAHFPAHHRRRAQRRAWATAAEALVPEVERLRAALGADEATVSADFNVDLRLRRNRRRLESGGYRIVAPRHGIRAIFGGRVIDGFLTTLHGTARHAGRVDGFDHPPVVADLTPRRTQ